MNKDFYAGNRKRLAEEMEMNSLAIFFAGHEPRKTNDEYYPFYTSRNFLYLTGLEEHHLILLISKTDKGIEEELYLQEHDMMLERWTGKRYTKDEVQAISGITTISYLNLFPMHLQYRIQDHKYETVYLDFDKTAQSDEDTEAYTFAEEFGKTYPWIKMANASQKMAKIRTIKQPCEIEAVRKAVEITKAGIVAMMKASHPGMYEYEYKAEWDHELAKRGVAPAFPSIVAAGDNNFCIHYYAYTGQAKDGDMILNDVGAQWDHLFNDVSRGWPCNGKFTEKQKQLYTCAYNTSQHMFSIIRPGMQMSDVDRLAREFCFTQLKALGLCDNYEEVGKYIWHGGAHHVGWDVHDIVDADGPICPGMIFCIDIGIYCEEWGIGFRLEDNCLVTEGGCENLTASIPRTIEEIEAVMAH